MNTYYAPTDFVFELQEWFKNNPDILEKQNYISFSEGCNFWQGKTHTEETKKILSLLNKGENNPMFNKKLTEEQKLKISTKQIGRPLSDSHKLSISKSKTGIPRSEETKRKISESRRKSNTN
jgi:hypothetical protein